MTEIVQCGDALLRFEGARIPRAQVAAIRDSAALLRQAKKTAATAEATVAEARREGYAAGRAEALDEMREALASALAALDRDLASENERRERAATAAALTATERLIGARDDKDVAIGLVREALRQAGADAVRIVVSGDMVEPVRCTLDPDLAERVDFEAGLPPLACRIHNRDGRIIADLDVQLAQLRQRWGLEAVDPDGTR